MSRILVVEDEPSLRRLITTILGDSGYTVEDVGSIREAVVQAGPFDLLIVDRRLPNGDGRKVAAHFPDTPVIITSGFEKDVDLPKPFGRTDLLEMVSAKLGGIG